MRRWIFVLLALLCAAALWVCGALFQSLGGQSLCRLTAVPDAAVAARIRAMAEARGLQFSAFAIGDEESLTLFECLFYHPEALGITLTDGSPITQAQIERGERVAMLSESAALALSPTLDVVGQSVMLGDTSYRVVGIYKHYEPIGFLARTARASAIVPLGAEEDARRIYVWTRPKAASPFAFQYARTALEKLDLGRDAQSFMAADIGLMADMNRQAIRFWTLSALLLFGIYALRKLAWMRRAFVKAVRRECTRHYGGRAALHLIGPFAWYVAPSLAVVAALAFYMVYCAKNLLISAQFVPARFLDPEAWLSQLSALAVKNNLAESMPVYAYALCAQLAYLTMACGALVILFLALSLMPKKRGG